MSELFRRGAHQVGIFQAVADHDLFEWLFAEVAFDLWAGIG